MHLIFDPHLHLFDYEKGNYTWLKSDAGPAWPCIEKLRRSFSEQDLTLTGHFNLTQFTHIEAGYDNQNPTNELAFLSQHCHKEFAAIGYAKVDSTFDEFTHAITLMSEHSSFIGIRDITEGPDSTRLMHANVKHNLAYLASHSLIFETQFELSNLVASKQLAALAKSMPNLQIVISHAGLVTQACLSEWQKGLEIVAKSHNISIKFSGFEMLPTAPSDAFKHHVLDSLLTHFGEQRVMFASNFPVCLMAHSYQSLWQSYLDMTLDSNLFKKLSYTNALNIYGKLNKKSRN